MSELLIENRGGVRILTMNRPDKRNALNLALSEALLAALRAAESDESVRRGRAHRRRARVLRRRRPVRVQGSEARKCASGRDPRRADDEPACHLFAPDEARRHRDQRLGHGRRRRSRARRRRRRDGIDREARLPGSEARHRRRDRDGQSGAPGRAQGGVRAGRRRRAGRRGAGLRARHGQPRDRAGPADGRGMRDRGKIRRGRSPRHGRDQRAVLRVLDLPFAQALEGGRDVNKRMRAFRKPSA